MLPGRACSVPLHEVDIRAQPVGPQRVEEERRARRHFPMYYIVKCAVTAFYPERNFSPSRRLAMTKWRGET